MEENPDTGPEMGCDPTTTAPPIAKHTSGILAHHFFQCPSTALFPARILGMSELTTKVTVSIDVTLLQDASSCQEGRSYREKSVFCHRSEEEFTFGGELFSTAPTMVTPCPMTTLIYKIAKK